MSLFLEIKSVIDILLIAMAGILISCQLISFGLRKKIQKKIIFSAVPVILMFMASATLSLPSDQIIDRVSIWSNNISKLFKSDDFENVIMPIRYTSVVKTDQGLVPQVIAQDHNGNMYTVSGIKNDLFYVKITDQKGDITIAKGNFIELVLSNIDEQLIIQVNNDQKPQSVFIKKSEKTIKDFVIVRNLSI